MDASISASKASEGLTVYSASKAALRSFARIWTIELKERKICVNAVIPGSIDIPIFIPSLMSKEEYEQFRIKTIPVGRIGDPDEVVIAVSFQLTAAAAKQCIELFVSRKIRIKIYL